MTAWKVLCLPALASLAALPSASSLAPVRLARSHAHTAGPRFTRLRHTRFTTTARPAVEGNHLLLVQYSISTLVQ